MIQSALAPAARGSEWLRPYAAAFSSRFMCMLQYRSAAVAGFVTQCWWGGIRVMILTAFYGATVTAGAPPISLSNAITYTWVGQALLTVLPWAGDPEVALAVRSGGVAYDRLRPVDAYALWYVRAVGWVLARALPRALMLFAVAALLLPGLGLQQWSWQAPSSLAAGAAFGLSLALSLLLSSAVLMLINVAVVAAYDDRGINALVTPLVVVFSGNLLPLGLFPESMSTLLLLQPLAGLLDIPMRIYFGQMAGMGILSGLGLQACWVLSLIGLGRMSLRRVFCRLEIQGG